MQKSNEYWNHPFAEKCRCCGRRIFLILLLIAMPLKYMYGMPLAVKLTGSIHGLLFVAYVGLAYYAKEVYQWSIKKFLQAFIAAWLPLGTFYFDSELKKEEQRISAGKE